MLTGTYSAWLVAASLLIAMLAAYTALDMAARVNAAKGSAARWWLAGGSLAMGIGIWSMHFVGMLAFHLPIPMGYDPALTGVSLLIAIASSAFALRVVCRQNLSWRGLGGAAVLMGSGVSAMHYAGMAAMRMTPAIRYVPSLFALSVLIAIAASGAALSIAFRLRRGSTRLLRMGASVVMGLAIAGMHYTGMAAARFPANATCAMSGAGMTAGWLALLIIIFTVGVLSVALTGSILDLRLELRTAHLVESLASANRELQFLAMHDRLTQLPNRALLEDRLDQKIHKARRDGTRFAALFLDLDGFKQVNDAYGHFVGDLLLIEVAKRIRGRLRESDTLARMGGDEFVMLVSIEDSTDAATLADKLTILLAEPFVIEGHEFRISASIGIVICDGCNATRDELLKNADAAMYHAKSLGRNTYCFFEQSMNDDAHRQLEMLRDLRHALEQREFTLHYQPLLHASDRRLLGAEALIRWQRGDRGLVPPDQFIPLAEKTGLIIPIGNWVLDEACRQMSAWHEAGFPHWNISVNLSAVQFNHPGLIDTVRETLHSHRLNPACLTLEITESTAMRDADISLGILQQLSEMGVRISIDDFGTGYSSLLYLKRLPASELKIDRGFVRDLDHGTEDAAIIAAIVALGQSLSLDIVAEGVETQQQQEFLTRLGCDSLQGYLLGRPMPAETFFEIAAQTALEASSVRIAPLSFASGPLQVSA